MKIVAIIQARMGSTRLPGKILKTVNGKTLLEYQVERVQRTKGIDEIIIATTIKETDLPIVNFCEQNDLSYYRGSEEDVLSRYYEAAVQFKADIVVRLTSDCPIIDPEVIDQTIRYHQEHEFDYVSNTMERTYPRGMDTEVFSLQSLKTAYHQAKLQQEREHVTAYMYTHPDEFRLGSVTSEADYSMHRWTVDTEEDFELIRRVIQELYNEKKEFTLQDIILLLKNHPEWVQINKHIEQKKI